MILTYNIFEGGDKEVIEKLLRPRGTMQFAQTRGHSRTLRKEHNQLNIRRYSFSHRIVNTWNALPDRIVHAKDVNIFKGLFDVFMCHLMLEHDMTD